MNFKALAIALSLTVATGVSFAADIDLSTADTSIDQATVEALASEFMSAGAAASDSNNAIIFQSGTSENAVAFIDQVGATSSVAVIMQISTAAASIAYIQQNATTGAVALITQR